MSDVLNPVEIEEAIRVCSQRIHQGVLVVTQEERAARAARRTHDVAYAVAYLDFDGPAHERRYAAEVATQDARAAADDAEVRFRHAERTARAVEAELRAWQSIGASVRLMYGATDGVGR
jgi:hypothetical protein